MSEPLEGLSDWKEDIDQTSAMLTEALEENQEETQPYLDKLLDIRLTLEKIEESGGVSRDMVTSFEDILPDNLPVKSFTRIPTETNLDTTVASLENDNKGWIVMIGIAIAGLIAKIVMWLFDRNSGKPSDEQVDQAVDTAQDNIKREEEASHKTRKEAEENVNDHVETQKWSRLTELCSTQLDDQMKAFLETQPLIFGTGGKFGTSSDLLTHLDNLIDPLSQGSNDLQRIGRSVKSLENLMEGAVKKLGGRSSDSLEGILREYQQELKDLKDEKASNKFDIHEYNRMMSDERRSGDNKGASFYVRSRDFKVDDAYTDKKRKDLENLQEKFGNMKKAEESGDSKQAEKVKFRNRAIGICKQASQAALTYMLIRDYILKADKTMMDALKEYKTKLED